MIAVFGKRILMMVSLISILACSRKNINNTNLSNTQHVSIVTQHNDNTRAGWNSNQNITQDGAGNYAKFSSPTVANGHVYLPTFSRQVVVYGLK